MTKQWQALCALFITTALFGCSGGGGGGSGSGGLTTKIYTDWSSVDPPENVAATGISQDTLYDVDADAPFDSKGISTSSTATIRYRADETIERIDILVPDVISLSWNEATGDFIVDNVGVEDPWVIAADSAKTELGVLFNPREMLSPKWEYQTFGAWATGQGVSGAIGGISVGTSTPDDRIRESFFDDLKLLGDPVTFTGHSAGIYIDSKGTAYYTKSDLSMDVEFFNNRLLLNTENTYKTDLADPIDGVPVLDNDLNMVGELFYIDGINAFTGVVSANGDAAGMSGTSTGRFYGPEVQELGGVFSLSGKSSPEYYSGAYGAARPSVP